MRCEAAALLEQAEAQQCCSGIEPEDTQQLAEQRGCIFQVLPELAPGHAARADSAAYFKQRDSWPCCNGVAAFLRSPQLLQLLQAALGSISLLLYNEQYIIKPPCSMASEFGWHYDSQRCSAQCGVQYSPYLSVLFWDDLWHCSRPNASGYSRTAYMAQFSSKALTWDASGQLRAIHLLQVAKGAASHASSCNDLNIQLQ
ncbi:hypothetical protein COO60DRAFT_1458689 [Scenedesmus sp. NREL 46B-D3]|nr:hypothetical protein COO60DRAFT_1458689 [Scenedesmus sp. NREL 46B-D3]